SSPSRKIAAAATSTRTLSHRAGRCQRSCPRATVALATLASPARRDRGVGLAMRRVSHRGADMAELHPDLQALIGSVIHERYRVDSLLGQGGMGAVFRGRHLGLARDVAIKVLRPELGRSDATSKRFDREAHSASRLDHPNCVRVFDFGTTENGIKYLVME